MLEIKIYGSECATTQYYKEYFEDLFLKEKIEAVFEIIQDEDKIAAIGLDIGCLFGYCPGCNSVHEDKKENEKFVPALVCDGEILCHSSFPKDDEAYKIIKYLKEKNQ